MTEFQPIPEHKDKHTTMETHRIEDMKLGWFIGNFEPSLFKTNDVEVAVKYYKKNDTGARHHHRIATEYTMIVSGAMVLNGKTYSAGEIVVQYPNHSTDFTAIEDTAVAVVKVPGKTDDKYSGYSDLEKEKGITYD